MKLCMMEQQLEDRYETQHKRESGLKRVQSTVRVQNLGSCVRHATTIEDFWYGTVSPTSCVAADATKEGMDWWAL